MKLNIVSFNIRCCDDDNNNTIVERAPRLSKIINKFDADVICLQEWNDLWRPHTEKVFSEKYDMFYRFRSETNDREACPVLWKKDKFECVKTGYFWYTETPEVESKGWDELYDCYRICIYAILKNKQTNETFTVMNTHFGFGDAGQVKSSGLIYEYSQKISDFKTFITGDFNMKPDSVGYKEIIKYFRDVNTCTTNDLGTTFHKYTPDVVTDAHIDYCFIDSNVIPVKQDIIRDTVDGKFPSDHYGLYIELEI